MILGVEYDGDASTVRLPGRNGNRLHTTTVAVLLAIVLWGVKELVVVVTSTDGAGNAAAVQAAAATQATALILGDIRDLQRDQLVQGARHGVVLEQIRDDMKDHVDHEREEHH